ncbi:MAG TPA: DUF4143 domain-containing protein, partial [Nitrospirae bacterium]|nr:DUF4143 domain-containing protein [Nitrospirota bacterium]
ISVLEASYIVFLLKPHYRNFNKRLVKTPKLYFCDTGFAAWLLGIRDPEQLSFHAQRGALFETLVATEFLKARFNQGMQSNLYFWRDSKGLEIDLVLEEGDLLKPVEIKSGQTYVPEFLTSLEKWRELSGRPDLPAMLVYGGEKEMTTRKIKVLPWKKLSAKDY